MKSGIYGIRNSVNGKWYVGQTIDLNNRKSVHFASLHGRYHHNDHLQSAFLKYGKECFEFYILEEAPITELDIKENEYISVFKSDQRDHGYNIERGGNNHRVCSDETRQKLSIANKGRRHSLESKKKIGDAHRGAKSVNYGKHPSPETLKKMSESMRGKNKGKHASLKTRKKISESGKGRIPWNKGKSGLYHVSMETRRKISATLKGIPLTEERLTRLAQMQKNRIGCHHSTDARKKMSDAKKGKPWTKARRLSQNKRGLT